MYITGYGTRRYTRGSVKIQFSQYLHFFITTMKSATLRTFWHSPLSAHTQEQPFFSARRERSSLLACQTSAELGAWTTGTAAAGAAADKATAALERYRSGSLTVSQLPERATWPLALLSKEKPVVSGKGRRYMNEKMRLGAFVRRYSLSLQARSACM